MFYHGRVERRYAIGTVAKLTGVSIDTVRAWERRYGLVVPERDRSGARFYDDRDVQRLVLARAATELGHPIRRVALLSNDEIEEITRVQELAPRHSLLPSADVFIEKTLDAIKAYDVSLTESELGKAALLISPDRFILTVLSPLMHAVGDMWERGRFSIAQEHLVTQLVRNLLGIMVRLRPPEDKSTIVYATPPGELHEFGIAFAACLANLQGFRSCVLGSQVPAEEVARAVRSVRAKIVVIGTMSSAERKIAAYVERLRDNLPRRTRIWVGGEMAGSRKMDSWPARSERIATLTDFSRRLASENP